LYFDLLGKDAVSYFFPSLTGVRTTTEHAFVSNDADSVIVHTHSMVLFAHHFWCHIAWRAARLFGVVLLPYSSYAKVCDLQVAFRIEDEVLWFDVSMYDELVVHEAESRDHTRHHELRLLLCECLSS